MRRIVLTFTLITCTAVAAAAQTEGRIGVGGSVSFVKPTSDGVDSVVGIGPLVRLNPKRGWGPAGALNGFRANLDNPSGADAFVLSAGMVYSIF